MSAGPLSPSVAAALAGPLARLADLGLGEAGRPPLLAVRSSGVAEDGAAASFAGLHDTELGLTADEVAPAVLRCWASLWSERAVGYRARRGLALDGDAMAVVVQALVPARAAAVVFTRHPVSGRSDQLLDQRGARSRRGDGLGHGHARHDRGRQGDAGGQSSSRRATPAAGPSLADDVRDELVGLCLEVERAFGAPVDIEAAHAADGWYLLQARPITTPVGRIDDRASSRSSGSTRRTPRSPGNGTTCTCPRRCRRSPATTSWRHRDGDGLRPSSDSAIPVEMRDPGLERICLLRARAPTSPRRSRPRCGSAGPRPRGRAIPTDRGVLARRGGARAPRASTPGSPRDRSRRCRRRSWPRPGTRSGARIGRCWSIHFYAIRGPYQVLEDLADLYESVIESAGTGRGARH